MGAMYRVSVGSTACMAFVTHGATGRATINATMTMTQLPWSLYVGPRPRDPTAQTFSSQPFSVSWRCQAIIAKEKDLQKAAPFSNTDNHLQFLCSAQDSGSVNWGSVLWVSFE